MASSNSHLHRSPLSVLIGRGDYIEGTQHFLPRATFQSPARTAREAPRPAPLSSLLHRRGGGKVSRWEEATEKEIPPRESVWQASLHPCCCAALFVGSQPRPPATAREQVTVWAQEFLAMRKVGIPCFSHPGHPSDSEGAACGLSPKRDAPSFSTSASWYPRATDTKSLGTFWEGSLNYPHWR